MSIGLHHQYSLILGLVSYGRINEVIVICVNSDEITFYLAIELINYIKDYNYSVKRLSNTQVANNTHGEAYRK